MEIKEAQDKTDEIIKHYGEYWEPLSQLARLTEEVGEVSRILNIKYGGKKLKREEELGELGEELADVMFGVMALANSHEIDLSLEFQNKILKDFDKMKGVYFKDDNTNS